MLFVVVPGSLQGEWVLWIAVFLGNDRINVNYNLVTPITGEGIPHSRGIGTLIRIAWRLYGGVFVAEFFFPAQVVDFVGEVAVGAGGYHVGGRVHDAGESSFDGVA